MPRRVLTHYVLTQKGLGSENLANQWDPIQHLKNDSVGTPRNHQGSLVDESHHTLRHSVPGTIPGTVGT